MRPCQVWHHIRHDITYLMSKSDKCCLFISAPEVLLHVSLLSFIVDTSILVSSIPSLLKHNIFNLLISIIHPLIYYSVLCLLLSWEDYIKTTDPARGGAWLSIIEVAHKLTLRQQTWLTGERRGETCTYFCSLCGAWPLSLTTEFDFSTSPNQTSYTPELILNVLATPWTVAVHCTYVLHMHTCTHRLGDLISCQVYVQWNMF